MLSVVNVDISLDNFKNTFGRNPTEHELSMLMNLQDKKNKAKKEYERRKALGLVEEQSKKSIRKEIISVSPRGMMVNKMLKYGLEPTQIADVLSTTFEKVINVMTRYRLPRKNVQLIKPTDYK